MWSEKQFYVLCVIGAIIFYQILYSPSISETENNKSNGNYKMGSGKMFDKIADFYDYANVLMSLNMDDSIWAKKLIESLDIKENDTMLDVATG